MHSTPEEVPCGLLDKKAALHLHSKVRVSQNHGKLRVSGC
jgi:hypothetical protein